MRTLLIILFIAMCLAQLLVPAMMIRDSEKVVSDGTSYKFRTQPIDPSDPFRGKYITLRFEATHIADTATWSSGEPVNVVFTTDPAGFATPAYITRSEPGEPYLRTTVSYTNQVTQEVYFNIPFNRFYMEETKARPAEEAYISAGNDTTRICYGLVSIGYGRAVITDVFIDDRSVRDIVRDADNGEL